MNFFLTSTFWSVITVSALVSTAEAAVINSQSFFNSGDTTIDFETFSSGGSIIADGTSLTNEYAGVVFSSEGAPNALQTTDVADASGRFNDVFRVLSSVSGGGSPTSGVRYASGDEHLGFTTSDMRIDFTTAVSAFGMYVIDNDFSIARIQAFNSIGNLLETVVVPQTSEGGFAYYGIDASGTGNAISYFILDGNDNIDLDSTYIDELSYRVVPIPAAIWLFGSGIIGLVGFARRK